MMPLEVDLEGLCRALGRSTEIGLTDSALAVLWWHDKNTPGHELSAGDIARLLEKHSLGRPNTTRLGDGLMRTKKVLRSTKGLLKLKATARGDVEELVRRAIGAKSPTIPAETAFLPEEAWKGTRGYIEKVCAEINGCHQFGFWNALSVLVRRLVETLLIEVYEAKKIETEIKGADGNYLMLRDIISRTLSQAHFHLGRDARKALDAVKELGDRAAHNRRFCATAGDVAKIESGLRVVVDELIALGQLR
jgi:hypothetical protein